MYFPSEGIQKIIIQSNAKIAKKENLLRSIACKTMILQQSNSDNDDILVSKKIFRLLKKVKIALEYRHPF